MEANENGVLLSSSSRNRAMTVFSFESIKASSARLVPRTILKRTIIIFLTCTSSFCYKLELLGDSLKFHLVFTFRAGKICNQVANIPHKDFSFGENCSDKNHFNHSGNWAFLKKLLFIGTSIRLGILNENGISSYHVPRKKG